MSTKALLYPHGFQLYDTLPANNDDHPDTMALTKAMELYWKTCNFSVKWSVDIIDGGGVGIDEHIETTSILGTRKDYTGNDILATDPRKLIGAGKKYTDATEFASPYNVPDVFTVAPAGGVYGGDKTWEAAFNPRGIMRFTKTQAQPRLIGGGTITCDGNGAVFEWRFQNTSTLPFSAFGPYFLIDGYALDCWFSYDLNGFGTSASGTIEITTLTSFIWP